jgi:Flp pilus assembly protein TadB
VIAIEDVGIYSGRVRRAHEAAKEPRPSMQEMSFEGDIMFATIAVVLLVLWLLGFVVFPVGGSLIHLLLVVGLIALVWHFVSGRRVSV